MCEAQAWKALGEYRRAIDSLRKAAELNPLFRNWRRNLLSGINWAHLREYDKARQALLKAKADAPNHQVVLFYLASVQAHAGEIENARETLVAYLQHSGHLWNTIEKMRHRFPNATRNFEFILEGLRKAGMPEK